MFDVEKLAGFAQDAIRDFAALHQGETFYAFCITGPVLSLNSEEAFAEALADAQEKDPVRYGAESWIKYVRDDPGCWRYVGFARFTHENGFDSALHDEHYALHFSAPEGQTFVTEYGLAMDRVMELLGTRDAFSPLKRADGFSMRREDYD